MTQNTFSPELSGYEYEAAIEQNRHEEILMSEELCPECTTPLSEFIEDREAFLTCKGCGFMASVRL